ncbi:ribose-5-phosphate isomerase [Paenibacillus algorifonticola]|uniref:Ribose-5-phosphate isomerase A n=1 Tax=Paenibacillus algorifonticola TaxID=684063 RepID=A0A1I1Z793_9BACL|nr:ribose-5-phosphate isomerase RpiA [Paenibacillus algorifonticola]SFE27158.1 ribose-5-phosphate isomerase [Paenibacillus algorifonticola]
MNVKQLAAEKAVQLVQDGMLIGLGTGTTAYWAILKLAQRMKLEGLDIKAVASSKQSEDLAAEYGIPLVPLAEITAIDLTIDGADEVDGELHLIKGGGGALLREKILAAHSKTFIVIVDESKKVSQLGHFPLPVEVVPFASNLTLQKLRELGCTAELRASADGIFVTDNGNYIADCRFGKIASPSELHEQLNAIPGVVENGLFISMASQVIVGFNTGETEILAPVKR